MRIESATDAKNSFGAIMDMALREPVVIQRSGRNSVVMLAYEDYEEMTALMDKLWGERASKAKRKGFIGPAKSRHLLNKLLHAED
jgi:prevent-host-death family protein